MLICFGYVTSTEIQLWIGTVNNGIHLFCGDIALLDCNMNSSKIKAWHSWVGDRCGWNMAIEYFYYKVGEIDIVFNIALINKVPWITVICKLKRHYLEIIRSFYSQRLIGWTHLCNYTHSTKMNAHTCLSAHRCTYLTDCCAHYLRLLAHTFTSTHKQTQTHTYRHTHNSVTPNFYGIMYFQRYCSI